MCEITNFPFLPRLPRFCWDCGELRFSVPPLRVIFICCPRENERERNFFPLEFPAAKSRPIIEQDYGDFFNWCMEKKKCILLELEVYERFDILNQRKHHSLPHSTFIKVSGKEVRWSAGDFPATIQSPAWGDVSAKIKL